MGPGAQQAGALWGAESEESAPAEGLTHVQDWKLWTLLHKPSHALRTLADPVGSVCGSTNLLGVQHHHILGLPQVAAQPCLQGCSLLWSCPPTPSQAAAALGVGALRGKL